jgi:hypothetical protein
LQDPAYAAGRQRRQQGRRCRIPLCAGPHPLGHWADPSASPRCGTLIIIISSSSSSISISIIIIITTTICISTSTIAAITTQSPNTQTSTTSARRLLGR